jgi:hypothetical protein
LALRSSVKQVLEEALEPKFVSYELISLEVLEILQVRPYERIIGSRNRRSTGSMPLPQQS